MGSNHRRQADLIYLVETALRVARDDVGIGLTERGANNRGEDIQWVRSLDGTGGRTGGSGAWCASWVSSVWLRASAISRVRLPFKTTRGARRLFRSVAAAGDMLNYPAAGAVACWSRGTGWQGHVELVESAGITPAGVQFYTYGGNRGAFPAGVRRHGPYSLRREREGRLLGFAVLTKIPAPGLHSNV